MVTRRWARATSRSRASRLAILQQDGAVDDDALPGFDTLQRRAPLPHPGPEDDVPPLEPSRRALHEGDRAAVLLDDRAERKHGHSAPGAGMSNRPEHVRTEAPVG